MIFFFLDDEASALLDFEHEPHQVDGVIRAQPGPKRKGRGSVAGHPRRSPRAFTLDPRDRALASAAPRSPARQAGRYFGGPGGGRPGGVGGLNAGGARTFSVPELRWACATALNAGGSFGIAAGGRGWSGGAPLAPPGHSDTIEGGGTATPGGGALPIRPGGGGTFDIVLVVGGAFENMSVGGGT